MVANSPMLRAVLASLPPARFAFAYGSGALRQSGGGSRRPVLDFVLAVDSPYDWHRKNMEVWPNAQHYSPMMRVLGSSAVSALQNIPMGANVYYNALVPFTRGIQIKYGVIPTQALLDDLTQWTTLYIAGRMHKPVRVLQSDSLIEEAADKNKQSATAAALLMLPEVFTEHEVFVAVAGLSYYGDARWAFGAEDPAKIKNIVAGAIDEFKRMYRPALMALEGTGGLRPLSTHLTHRIHSWRQSTDPAARAQMLRILPNTFAAEVRALIAERYPAPGSALRKVVARRVFAPSVVQAVKGLATAGLWRSVRYAFAKLDKGWNRARLPGNSNIISNNK